MRSIQSLFPLLIGVFFPNLCLAQTTVTYSYDSAGNRMGRSAPVQALASVSAHPSVEFVAINEIVALCKTTPVQDMLLPKDADSIPNRSETALWAAGPFTDEQNRPLLFTKGITDLPGRQNRPPMLTKMR